MSYNQPAEVEKEVFGDKLTMSEHIGALFHITVHGFTEHTFPKKDGEDKEPKPTKQAVCDIAVIAAGYLPESKEFEGKVLKNVKLSNVEIYRSLKRSVEEFDTNEVLARIGQAPKDDHGNRALVLNNWGDGDDKLTDAFFKKNEKPKVNKDAVKKSNPASDGEMTDEQKAKIDAVLNGEA